MSKKEWEQAYSAAWETYYTSAHLETILRRAFATGTSPGKAVLFITWFKGCIGIEKLHPLEGGFLRLKFRRDRRSCLPLESPLLFYPKYLAQTVWNQIRWISLYMRIRMVYLKIKRDPRRFEYTDLALEPVADDEFETRELFQSEVAQAYVGHLQQLEKMRRGEVVR
jgi:hypothetical protein